MPEIRQRTSEDEPQSVGAAAVGVSGSARAAVAAIVLTIQLMSGCAGVAIVTSAPTSAETAATPSASPSVSPTVASTQPPSSSPSPSPAPASAPPLRLPKDVVVVLDEKTYIVSGDSANALAAAMTARQLRDFAGNASFALTTWDIRWRYDHVGRPGGRCGLGNLRVSLRTGTLMPKWDPAPTAEPGLVIRWRTFIDALTIHERGHVQSSLDRAGETVRALSRIADFASCPALDKAANAAGSAIIAKGRAWDLDYDARTNHGRAQGATFP